MDDTAAAAARVADGRWMRRLLARASAEQREAAVVATAEGPPRAVGTHGGAAPTAACAHHFGGCSLNFRDFPQKFWEIVCFSWKMIYM